MRLEPVVVAVIIWLAVRRGTDNHAKVSKNLGPGSPRGLPGFLFLDRAKSNGK